MVVYLGIPACKEPAAMLVGPMRPAANPAYFLRMQCLKLLNVVINIGHGQQMVRQIEDAKIQQRSDVFHEEYYSMHFCGMMQA